MTILEITVQCDDIIWACFLITILIKFVVQLDDSIRDSYLMWCQYLSLFLNVMTCQYFSFLFNVMILFELVV